MNEQAAVVIGATGLTGSLVVAELLKDNAFKTVRILVRTPAGITHPKLIQQIVNFNDIDDYTTKFGYGDVIFCCIGTTRNKVKGNKEAYIKIDFDIPINAARMGVVNKFKKFLIVSAIGANEKSSNFYLRLKGKTENALQQFSFNSISIFRPSLLTGRRKENRAAEKIAEGIMEIFSFIFFGYLKKYHPVSAATVAKAMVKQSKNDDPGVHYFEYQEIVDLVGN